MTSTQAQIGDTLMGSQPLSPGSEQGGGSLVLQVLALPVVYSVLHGAWLQRLSKPPAQPAARYFPGYKREEFEPCGTRSKILSLVRLCAKEGWRLLL